MAVELLDAKSTNYGRGLLPPADSIPTYYSSTEPAKAAFPDIVEALQDLGGKRLITVFGYGSSFNGESSDSLMDFVPVVDDISKFHHQNRELRSADYDPITRIPGLHEWLNRFTPNYYPSSLVIDGQRREIKYGVIGYEDFIRQTGDLFEGGAYLYTAGRMQKAAIYPFILGDEERQSQIDLAINQARIDGTWLALGLLPRRFGYEQFALTYISLSYLADARAEKPDKIQILFEQSKEDYKQMLGDVLKLFIDSGILAEAEDGSFEKRISLKGEDVMDLIGKGKSFSRRINYVKNAITFGPIRAIQYGWPKYLKGHPELAVYLYPERQIPEGIQLKEDFQLDEAALRNLSTEVDLKLSSPRDRRP